MLVFPMIVVAGVSIVKADDDVVTIILCSTTHMSKDKKMETRM